MTYTDTADEASAALDAGTVTPELTQRVIDSLRIASLRLDRELRRNDRLERKNTAANRANEEWEREYRRVVIENRELHATIDNDVVAARKLAVALDHLEHIRVLAELGAGSTVSHSRTPGDLNWRPR